MLIPVARTGTELSSGPTIFMNQGIVMKEANKQQQMMIRSGIDSWILDKGGMAQIVTGTELPESVQQGNKEIELVMSQMAQRQETRGKGIESDTEDDRSKDI